MGMPQDALEWFMTECDTDCDGECSAKDLLAMFSDPNFPADPEH